MGGTAMLPRCLGFSCGRFRGSTFLNVIVASMSSPAKTVSSLNDTKTRRLEDVDMFLCGGLRTASRGHPSQWSHPPSMDLLSRFQEVCGFKNRQWQRCSIAGCRQGGPGTRMQISHMVLAFVLVFHHSAISHKEYGVSDLDQEIPP